MVKVPMNLKTLLFSIFLVLFAWAESGFACKDLRLNPAPLEESLRRSSLTVDGADFFIHVIASTSVSEPSEDTEIYVKTTLFSRGSSGGMKSFYTYLRFGKDCVLKEQQVDTDESAMRRKLSKGNFYIRWYLL